MINEIRSNARSIDNPKVARPTSDRSPHKHGIAGALLGATWFGAAFPLMVTAVAGVVGFILIFAAFITYAAYAPRIRNAGCAMFAMSRRPKTSPMPRTAMSFQFIRSGMVLGGLVLS